MNILLISDNDDLILCWETHNNDLGVFNLSTGKLVEFDDAERIMADNLTEESEVLEWCAHYRRDVVSYEKIDWNNAHMWWIETEPDKEGKKSATCYHRAMERLFNFHSTPNIIDLAVKHGITAALGLLWWIGSADNHKGYPEVMEDEYPLWVKNGYLIHHTSSELNPSVFMGSLDTLDSMRTQTLRQCYTHFKGLDHEAVSIIKGVVNTIPKDTKGIVYMDIRQVDSITTCEMKYMDTESEVKEGITYILDRLNELSLKLDVGYPTNVFMTNMVLFRPTC